MLGSQSRWQEDLFVAGPLRDLIPDDHILRRVDAVLDLSWLRDEVRSLYDAQNGRPGIDPEAAVRLMLAGLFQGISSDRKLMREAQVNLAMRWFAGYRLHEKLPDHSSLTRIRQRWGADRFKQIFLKSVQACGQAGLIDGETVHIDATLIRADVSWESLTQRHVEKVLAENDTPEDEPPPDSPKKRRGRPRKQSKPKVKKYSPTDPDATMTTSCRQYRMEPCFKQHTAVDDRAGVVVDVAVTTGEASEGQQLQQQVARIEANTGETVATVTADGGYAHGENFAAFEAAGVDAIMPPQKEKQTAVRIPMRRFKYDAKHDVVRCPAKKVLHPSTRTEQGQVYRARSCDCRACPMRERCFSATASSRTIVIGKGYEALLRARRRRRRWSAHEYGLYARHRWRAEGAHGEAKTQHGLRRAARRGLSNVAIQVYLTAAVMNLKRLAAFYYVWTVIVTDGAADVYEGGSVYGIINRSRIVRHAA
ncbi:MAG: transposase [Phycisphaerae bacterium]|nr:MAG: transposase [Phycisphaerae bacterium]